MSIYKFLCEHYKIDRCNFTQFCELRKTMYLHNYIASNVFEKIEVKVEQFYSPKHGYFYAGYCPELNEIIASFRIEQK